MARKGNSQQTAGAAGRKSSNTSLSEIQNHCDDKISLLEATFHAKLDALFKVIEQKDEVIGRLNIEIGELKQSFNFLSQETTDIKSSIKETSKILETKINENESHVKAVKTKTVDLEDRSRRCNLVFYNFPETGRNEAENCEDVVCSHLGGLGIFPPGEEIWIERAHRLGRRTPEHSTKPRPIIVCFSYFKQKEIIIKSGARFKRSPINVSEDYSRETLEEHKRLRSYGFHAKENYQDADKEIKYFKVTYKRLLITYSVNKTNPDAPTFVKSYTMKDMINNQNWFVPAERQ